MIALDNGLLELRERGSGMRVMFVRLIILLLFALGTCAYGEPVEPTKLSFGLPFNCSEAEASNKLCLADKFVPGRTVVLINEKDVCNARTGTAFTYEGHPGGAFEATPLEGAEKCSELFSIAVVGTDPAVVGPIAQKYDQTPLPKDIESKARELVKSSDEEVELQWPISQSAPKVLRAGEKALVMFECGEHAAVVLLANNTLFPLEGRCTCQHQFFTIGDKLYLTYLDACCGCGWQDRVVCDLSGGTPEIVYVNGAFSM
jgi:hypothetical protein